MSAPKTSPAAVSARLKRAGFTTVATRNLEGIRVSRGVLGEVCIVVDHDSANSARRVADLVDAELRGWEGYEYRRRDDVFFYVSKSAPAAPVERIIPETAKLNPWYLLGALGAHLDGGNLDVAAWNKAVKSAEAYYAEEQARRYPGGLGL